MNYRQCLAFLYNLQRLGIKLGLVNVESFLNYVGNPQHSFPSIHIAGTNGKGSVCAMLESVLNHSGYKTGLYTSPHLVSFRERVRISGREMETDFITEFVNRHRDRIARQQLTFFEATTALAFLYFQQKKVDIAVIETGLGGRLDATNTILPEAAGITGIGMEHTDILGKTLRKIAFEKAGIIKPGKPTVVGKVSRQVGIQLKEICKSRGSKFVHVPERSAWRSISLGLTGSIFSARIGQNSFQNLQVNLAGRHQIDNAIFALNMLEVLKERGWKAPDSAVRRGLQSVNWPARFQIYRKKPLVILDAAHNPPGVRVLLQTFADLLPSRKVTFLFGVMEDKDYADMLKTMSGRAKRFIFVRPNIDRAAGIDKLSKAAGRLGLDYSTAKSVRQAYRSLITKSSASDVICITGSHYTIGEFLS